MMMMISISAELGKRLYHRWITELWNGDLDAAHELVSPDFVVHQERIDQVPSENVRGPDAVVRMIRDSQAILSDLTFEITVGPIVEDDLVAGRWIGRGTYRGTMPGASAAPGTRVTFGGSDILRVVDGRFSEYW
jgi:hypothetical protein